MVKNTQGGSGHKKFARKHNNHKGNNKLRTSNDEGEIYGIVTKLLGNGMFYVHCVDNTLRLGHIRGKFSGRNKRDNKVEIGKWVLIGLREWDVSSEKSSIIVKGKTKMQQCDLLEVYTDTDKELLRDSVTEDWRILDENDLTKATLGDSGIDSDIVFGTERDFERERLIEEMKSSNTEKITFKIGEDTSTQDEEIDYADI